MMFLVSSSMGLQIGQSTGPTRRAVIGGAGAAFVSNFAFPPLPPIFSILVTRASMQAIRFTLAAAVATPSACWAVKSAKSSSVALKVTEWVI